MKTLQSILEYSTISRDGEFKDYFGEDIHVGDIVIFLATDFRDSKDFYKAEVKSLITNKNGEDYCIIKVLESPYNSSKIKDGAKKRCDLCIVIHKN